MQANETLAQCIVPSVSSIVGREHDFCGQFNASPANLLLVCVAGLGGLQSGSVISAQHALGYWISWAPDDSLLRNCRRERPHRLTTPYGTFRRLSTTFVNYGKVGGPGPGSRSALCSNSCCDVALPAVLHACVTDPSCGSEGDLCFWSSRRSCLAPACQIYSGACPCNILLRPVPPL